MSGVISQYSHSSIIVKENFVSIGPSEQEGSGEVFIIVGSGKYPVSNFLLVTDIRPTILAITTHHSLL